MAKDPAFLFYASDFLTGVSDLTMKERGQYITMLCIQHQKGYVSSKWLSINITDASSDVLTKFSIDENGNYFSDRLSIEIDKRNKHIPIKIASATLGGLISSSKIKRNISIKIREAFNVYDYIDFDKEEVKQKVSEWFKQMLDLLVNENEINNTLSNNKEIGVEKNSFEIFWDLYDKKVGDRTKIEKKFNSLSEEVKNLIFEYLPKYIQYQPDKKYRKNPDTFLNQKAWNDEIIPSSPQTISKAESAINVHDAVKKMLEVEEVGK
jgi:hypothetical protein